MFVHFTVAIIGVERRKARHTYERVLVILAILQWTTILLMPIIYVC